MDGQKEGERKVEERGERVRETVKGAEKRAKSKEQKSMPRTIQRIAADADGADAVCCVSESEAGCMSIKTA